MSHGGGCSVGTRTLSEMVLSRVIFKKKKTPPMKFPSLRSYTTSWGMFLAFSLFLFLMKLLPVWRCLCQLRDRTQEGHGQQPWDSNLW